MGKLCLKNWHRQFFKNYFYNPATPFSIKKAKSEVDFIIKKTGINKEWKILDLCCGPGRHSIIFAKRKYDITGIDFSPEYLNEARKKAKKLNLKIKFIRKDMRNINFKDEFDLVLNLFTSFGYFINEKDDLKVLKNINIALKKNGLLLIDILNGNFVRKNFRPRNWQIIEDGTYHLEETKLINNGKDSINTWIRIKRGKTIKRIFFLRLYNKKRISQALLKMGFKPIKFWGNFKGKKLSDKTNRLIVLAKKY